MRYKGSGVFGRLERCAPLLGGAWAEYKNFAYLR